MNIGIIFGGKSAEHEVSLMSVTSLLQAIDRNKYNLTLFYISKEGIWQIYKGLENDIVKLNEKLSGNPISSEVLEMLYNQVCIIPVLHGPHGEDGSLQGLFESLEIPYVGSKVLGSSVCMDKIISKKIMNHVGLKTVDFFELYGQVNQENYKQLKTWIKSYPVFVKPSNMGSSVGISKVENEDELLEALELAFKYDSRLLVEEGIDAREIECAVLESDEIIVSGVGEVIASNKFYDYEAKYTDDGEAKMAVPAENLSSDTICKIQDFAKRAFLEHSCNGLARIDFFVERTSHEVILNEINTLPGLTEFSMYPSLFEASGISYTDLIDHLINNAIKTR